MIAHLSHLASTLLLYALAVQIAPGEQTTRKSIAKLTACLHILSPAGLFLSTPYAESLFACLNFSGFLFCARSWQTPESFRDSVVSSIYIVVSGACFGLASTARGNGALSALVYVEPGLILLGRLARRPLDFTALLQAAATGAAGLLTIAGVVFPQYIAYRQYCTNDPGHYPQPWCSKVLPSVYTYVQEHYW